MYLMQNSNFELKKPSKIIVFEVKLTFGKSSIIFITGKVSFQN